MDPRLRQIVDEVKAHGRHEGFRVGASSGGVSDGGALLQLTLVERGLQYEFDEDDLIEAAVAVGVDEDDAGDWVDSFATWL